MLLVAVLLIVSGMWLIEGQGRLRTLELGWALFLAGVVILLGWLTFVASG